MKKIIITILVGLFSCQTPVVNNDKVKDVKIENNPFSGKDCKPYNIGKPPSEVILPKLIFFTKSPKEKKEFYSGEIKAYINENLLPFQKGERIEIIKENQEKILALENKLGGYRGAIKSNNLNFIGAPDDSNYMIHFSVGTFEIIFNNSCEYDFFKSKVQVTKNEKIFEGVYGLEIFEGDINIKDEKIDVETVQYLLKEYNKYYIDDIKEIEFSSTNALKTFMMFIRLTTQEAPFYKDIVLNYYPAVLPQPTVG